MLERSTVSRSTLLHGAVFMLVGLLWGIVIPKTPFPRLALSAHLQLTTSGLMFLIAGLVIGYLNLGNAGFARAIFLIAPWTTWAMALSEVANSWWGAHNILPLAAQQAGATGAASWKESIVAIAHVAPAIVLIIYWATIIVGMIGKPGNPPAKNPE